MIDPRGRAGTTLPGAGVAALAALLALLVDLNALPGAFIGDDFEIVVRNPLVVRCDWRGILTTDYWGGGGDSGLYRPLTILSYALNRAAFGPGPLSFHLVNVLLHAGTTFFLARFLLALGAGRALAGTAAALFAVHPIHADVVNVVVGRAELLVAVFVFAGLWLALGGGPRGRPLALACFAAALLSKEHALVFLPLLVAADAFAAADCRAAWRERRAFYALLLAVAAGWLLLRGYVLEASEAPPLMIYAADNPLAGAGLPARLLTAAKVNLLYVSNLLLPLRLQSVYSGPGLRAVTSVTTPWGAAALAYGLLCAVALAHGWRRRRPWAFGLFLFLAGFAVTANLAFPITVLMADRFSYLPAAGFCLAAAWALLLPSRQARAPHRAGLLLLPACAALLLATQTLSRNAAFREPEAFWRSVTKIDPGNVRAWFFLAQAAWEAGRVDEAGRALEGTLRADPSFPDGWTAWSLFLLERGRPAEAAAAAREALARAPGGIGLAQLALARAYLQLGRPAEALGLLEEASPMFPGSSDFLSARGLALEALGRDQEAVEAYQLALAIRDDPVMRGRLERLLRRGLRPPPGG